MVQLKVVEKITGFTGIITFQFQNGSIKRTILKVFPLWEVGFNSKMVQLKAENVIGEDNGPDCFNSKMVQLKAFQLLFYYWLCTSFNSKMVQLKGKPLNPSTTQATCFNSKMVQLKARPPK